MEEAWCSLHLVMSTMVSGWTQKLMAMGSTCMQKLTSQKRKASHVSANTKATSRRALGQRAQWSTRTEIYTTEHSTVRAWRSAVCRNTLMETNSPEISRMGGEKMEWWSLREERSIVENGRKDCSMDLGLCLTIQDWNTKGSSKMGANMGQAS